MRADDGRAECDLQSAVDPRRAARGLYFFPGPSGAAVEAGGGALGSVSFTRMRIFVSEGTASGTALSMPASESPVSVKPAYPISSPKAAATSARNTVRSELLPAG